MTLLMISAIRQCRARSYFRRDIWPGLKNAARPTAYRIASRHLHSPLVATRLSRISPQMLAFQCHQNYFSTHAAPSTKLRLSTYTKSDVTTISDPGQISCEDEYILGLDVTPRDKTGTSGSGMVLYDSDGSELWWGYQCLGEATPNEAGYISLITGLKYVQSLGVQRVTALDAKEAVVVHRRSADILYPHNTRDKCWNDGGEITPRETSNTEDLSPLKQGSISPKKTYVEPPNTENLASLEKGSITPEKAYIEPPNTENVSPLKRGSITPDKTYVLRFDGGSRGNPGMSGAGMVLYDGEDGSELWSGCQYLGDHNTNNEAEYMGLITGLQCARSLGVERIVVQGDSKLILSQVEGTWKVKSPTLKDYYEQAISLRRQFASFQSSHILRARNGRADELANEAMDSKSSRGFQFHEE
eukprot:CAMPEP_0181135260 /NCGR_PEP_ID=MMETSP1071-20121207/32526_1 /TAXON_ID=35127 /ORGANISM="Thalassiosira sp., Strain NH16" /LENGTH=414 /DNA_ID=CAMNT_0023221833 /DNA_START=90 /DNA_END=1333 /DNA_ORIENTATION=-